MQLQLHYQEYGTLCTLYTAIYREGLGLTLTLICDLDPGAGVMKSLRHVE